MAVEVEFVPKRLHRHVLPIVMVVTGLLALSLVSTYKYTVSGEGTGAAVANSLITSVINVKPKPNGLADISLNDHQPQPKAGSSLEGNVSQAGRSAQITLMFR
ncbi:MAG: hypothetical protein AAB436_02040 [Patescibacteria group bacterium]